MAAITGVKVNGIITEFSRNHYACGYNRVYKDGVTAVHSRHETGGHIMAITLGNDEADELYSTLKKMSDNGRTANTYSFTED